LFQIVGDEMRLSLAARPEGDRPTSLDSKRSKQEVLIFRRDPADAERIVGKAWELLEGEIDPQTPVTADKQQPFGRGDAIKAELFSTQQGFGGQSLTFDGANFRFRGAAFYQLRRGVTINEIDLVLLSGSELGHQGDIVKGIYQLTDKELVLVFPRNASRGSRPTSFDIKGTPNIKITLRAIPSRPTKVVPKTPTRLDELRREQVNVINDIRDRMYEGLKKQTIAVVELVAIERVAYQAARDSAKTPEQHIAACEMAVTRMKELEQRLVAEVKAGRATELTHLELMMHRLKIEIECEELKQATPKP
jgi:hypothetical protein